MDQITKHVIKTLGADGWPIDAISYELGETFDTVKAALKDSASCTNILADQLASRLPALVELSCKQLHHIILNGDLNQRLRAINIVLKTSTALAKIKPN